MCFRLFIVIFALIYSGSIYAEELHKAVREGDIKEVRRLISSGTNVNLRSKKGQTPLYSTLSGSEKSYNKEMILLLIELGADVNAKNTEDKTITIPPNDDLGLIKVLIESMTGYTPLHAAASAAIWKNPPTFYDKKIPYKEGEIISLLIKHKANVNAKSKKGDTPLHNASTAKVTEILIKHGAKLNAKNHRGETPLHTVISSFSAGLEVAFLLIKKGANVNAKDKKGNTPLYALIDKISQDKSVLRDIKYIVTEKPYKSYFAEQLSLITSLVKHGADINIQDKSGDTFLHKVSVVKVANTLIENGAKLNIQNHDGNTPLHNAILARYGNLEIAFLLVEKGADVNTKNKKENTPLHELAHMMYIGNAYSHYTDSVFYKQFYRSHVIRQLALGKLLMKKGVNVNAKNVNGNSPLHLTNNVELASLLIKHGAKITAKNKKNQTPFDLADISEDKEMTSLLIKHRAKSYNQKTNL